MVEEAASFNKELISLCFRFVDSEQKIREEFLDFIDTERSDGLSLFNKITNWYSRKGLDTATRRGQAYDGAATMSSESVGLGAQITEVNPRSIYIHCMSH